MTDTTRTELAAQAYIYGFPLVFNLDQVNRYVHDGVGANPAAPFNTFSHARTLAGPADTFVTIDLVEVGLVIDSFDPEHSRHCVHDVDVEADDFAILIFEFVWCVRNVDPDLQLARLPDVRGQQGGDRSN